MYVQDGFNALMLAAKSGHTSLVQQLVVYIRGHGGGQLQPLSHVDRKVRVVIGLQLLVNLLCCAVQKGLTAFALACKGGHMDTAAELLEFSKVSAKDTVSVRACVRVLVRGCVYVCACAHVGACACVCVRVLQDGKTVLQRTCGTVIPWAPAPAGTAAKLEHAAVEPTAAEYVELRRLGEEHAAVSAMLDDVAGGAVVAAEAKKEGQKAKRKRERQQRRRQWVLWRRLQL